MTRPKFLVTALFSLLIALSVNAQQRIARSAELRLTRNDPYSTAAGPFAQSPVTRKDTLSVSVVRIVAVATCCVSA